MTPTTAILWLLTGSPANLANWHELSEFPTITSCVVEAKSANSTTHMLGWFQCQPASWLPPHP